MSATTASALAAVVDAFNRDVQVGSFVRYWTGAREGAGKVSTTSTRAQLLSGHTPVVWVADEDTCIKLTHINPFPHQPDGLDDLDSSEMPTPTAAAARVRAYITEFGDGLYNVCGGAPLYGRDLEALCRHALRDAT